MWKSRSFWDQPFWARSLVGILRESVWRWAPWRAPMRPFSQLGAQYLSGIARLSENSKRSNRPHMPFSGRANSQFQETEALQPLIGWSLAGDGLPRQFPETSVLFCNGCRKQQFWLDQMSLTGVKGIVIDDPKRLFDQTFGC
jgi:hypothetical protein